MGTRTTPSARQTEASGGNINGNWDQHASPSRLIESSRDVTSELGGEGRATKGSYNPSSSSMMPSRPSEPTPASSIRADPFPTPASRRRQSALREQKPLQNPGLLQHSPSKRLTYGSLSNSQVGQRNNIPLAYSEAQPKQPFAKESSRLSFAPPGAGSKQDTSQTSFDFLPSVNFDDLHSSIGSINTDNNQFGGSGEIAGGDPNDSSIRNHRPDLGRPAKTIGTAELGSHNTLNGSSLRRNNSSAQQKGQNTADIDKVAPSNGSASARARRKTYFPSSHTGATPNGPTIRAPRKSVGPGILTMDAEGSSHPHRRPTLAQAGLGETASANSIMSMAGRRNVSDISGGTFEGTSRHNKTKSLQPPPRRIHIPEHFFTPSGTPEQSIISPMSTTESPGKSDYHRTITPSSSKRASMMPGSAHATGLGARTISPTDARRLKRMSMMPNPPPMPHTPLTPHPDHAGSLELPHAPSPSMPPRKSVTPSSSRTTPDPNRKSYSSGVSNSSTTSYNSCLASSGSIRTSQSLSSSRLPTPKNRNDVSSIGDDEVVPPVPAIPKAYESPKGEFEHPPFFATRKSSLGHDVSSLNSTSASADMSSPVDVEPPKLMHAAHRYKGRNAGQPEPATERKSNIATNAANRRNLQPLRLPPLNLLPLSTPTASKIAALHEASASKDMVDGNVTPPPKTGPKGTPTTPMTASKASFTRNYYEDMSAPLPAQVRSSSSHYNMRSEALSYRAPSSSSTTIPAASDSYALTASRTAMSPFVSSSLPKSGGDFGPLRLEKSNTFDAGPEIILAKLTGPRLQKPRKASKDDASSINTTSSAEPSTHSIGSSIRRKLSLTRKRSNSKAQTAAERDEDAPPKPPKHDDMPPPRLPASATWSGPLMSSPSPSQRANASRTSRNVSTSTPTSKLQITRTQSSAWGTADIAKKEPRPQEREANTSTKRNGRSAVEGTQSQNSLSLKDFLKEAKTMELSLDRDDLSAEDEMKKLASKRKETEIAAKEVDALRRRANPKERVGPTAALRMAQLNIFERGEIIDYKDIYFCGTKEAKKHVGDLSTELANFGYDDERGDYNIVAGDHLAYRYEIVDILGKGSFGQVVRCIDHKTGVLVAIKIIRNKKRFHQQALVEVEILQKLREWDPANKHSMVTFVQSFYFRSHLCISTELLGMNLYEFIKCHDFRGFSLKLIRRFAKQLLSSLVLLKSKKVIHCDLKPENVLLAHPTRSEIKVIDFGSSCLENEKVYTYIQSRFYRSPEVILGMTYGMPIDMWSLGCILAELLTGYPIFPGENEQEQLACIMEVFGPPEKHLIEKSTRKKLFFDSLGKPRITVSTKGKRRRPSSKSLQQALKCEDEVFLDFISRCLRWDPDRRLKPDEAVHHEFITGKTTKQTARPRTAPSNTTSSPIKRYNSISQTPASTRPLPDPPATSFKNGSAIRTREVSASSQSPSKPAGGLPGPKRHSTMTGVQGNGTGPGGKRMVAGTAVQASALPRVTSTQRVGMGGGKSMELAAAAAAVSLKPR